MNNLLLKSTPPIIRVPLDFSFDEDLWELIDEQIKIEKLKINPKDNKLSGKLSDATFIYEIKNVSKEYNYYLFFASRIALSNSFLFGKNISIVSQSIWTNDIRTYEFFNVISTEAGIIASGENYTLDFLHNLVILKFL